MSIVTNDYMEKAEHYEYKVAWHEEDEVYVASVTEWPSLQAHGSTQAEALEELKEVVAFTIEDCENEGDSYPEPHADEDFSGRFNVRLPTSLHRELRYEADAEGVSMNQLVVWKLSR